MFFAEKPSAKARVTKKQFMTENCGLDIAPGMPSVPFDNQEISNIEIRHFGPQNIATMGGSAPGRNFD